MLRFKLVQSPVARQLIADGKESFDPAFPRRVGQLWLLGEMAFQIKGCQPLRCKSETLVQTPIVWRAQRQSNFSFPRVMCTQEDRGVS